ncbi:MAG TPA: YigZ family protein, partial [Ruminococcaceae bacterium]|nr:YigZ family protein [Oscillospiraceae bacterium]
YFGGILLGAGGLTRAYAKAAADAVAAASIRLFARAVSLEITLDYSLYGRLAAVYAEFGAKICSEEFSEQVKSSVYVREERAKALCERLCDVCNGKVSIVEGKTDWFDFA